MRSKKVDAYLVHTEPPKAQDNPRVLRILLLPHATQIDFGYVAPWIYKRGGWIRIAPHTHIKYHGANQKFHLLDSKNIPIAPKHHHFESVQDWMMFSLWFEALPATATHIDIIEEEFPSADDFNFYNISLQPRIPLIM